METDFEQCPTHLKVTARGTFVLEEAVAIFERMLLSCQSTGQTLVLIDITELTGFSSATLRVLFALGAREHYQRYLANGGELLRVAFLGGERSFLSWQPAMELAPRPGAGVQTFTDLEAALAWLGI